MKKTFSQRLLHASAASAAIAVLASGSALAATYVTGPLPSEFGGGFIPPDPAVLKNVQKASKEAAKLAASVEKCYAKGAANFSKGKATGVSTCLDDPSKGVLPKFNAKIQGIMAKAPGLPPCFDFVAAGGVIADLVRGFNPQTYCDGGPPASCSQVKATIITTYADPDASGVTTFVDYPGDKADIPGANQDPSVQERIVNVTGINDGLFSVGDQDGGDPDLFDDRMSAGLLSLNAAIPSGSFAEATFDCRPGQVPLEDEFSCTIDAGDFDGNVIAGSCDVVLTYFP